MSNANIFSPLSRDEFETAIKNVRKLYDLLAIKLTNSDVLLGAIHRFWRVPELYEYGDHWRWDGKTLTISFNSPAGLTSGDQYLVNVPIDKIADISVIPLSEESIPHRSKERMLSNTLGNIGNILPVDDYPNPLASIIYEHNEITWKSNSFDVYIYSTKSSSYEANPPEGINLDREMILYTDIRYFDTQAKYSFNLSINLPIVTPIFSVGMEKSSSFDKKIMSVLKSKKASQKGLVGNYCKLQGCLLSFDQLQIDTIEGVEYRVFKLVHPVTTQVTPIILKANSLKLPIELIGKINNILTLFGELIPFPLSTLGENYQSALLTRAMAYIPSS